MGLAQGITPHTGACRSAPHRLVFTLQVCGLAKTWLLPHLLPRALAAHPCSPCIVFQQQKSSWLPPHVVPISSLPLAPWERPGVFLLRFSSSPPAKDVTPHSCSLTHPNLWHFCSSVEGWIFISSLPDCCEYQFLLLFPAALYILMSAKLFSFPRPIAGCTSAETDLLYSEPQLPTQLSLLGWAIRLPSCLWHGQSASSFCKQPTNECLQFNRQKVTASCKETAAVCSGTACFSAMFLSLPVCRLVPGCRVLSKAASSWLLAEAELFPGSRYEQKVLMGYLHPGWAAQS